MIGYVHGRWFWQSGLVGSTLGSPWEGWFKKSCTNSWAEGRQTAEKGSVKIWKRLKMHYSSSALTLHHWSEELCKSASYICTPLILCSERRNANTPNQAMLDMCTSTLDWGWTEVWERLLCLHRPVRPHAALHCHAFSFLGLQISLPFISLSDVSLFIPPLLLEHKQQLPSNKEFRWV